MAFFTCVGIAIIAYYFVYGMMLIILDSDIVLAMARKFGKKLVKINGKIIWISEASSNEGEAMAYEIARNNGKMILSASKEEGLVLIKEKCLKINPSLKPEDILILAMDITKTETHKFCFDSVINHFGSIDILIYGGGRLENAVWEDIDIRTDLELFKTNVFGIISLARIVVGYFGKKGKGQIAVNTGLAGIIALPYSSTYSATSHAVLGYLESLKNEKMGKNLQITLLCPGPVGRSFSCRHHSRNDLKNFKWMNSGVGVLEGERFGYLAMVAVVNKLDEAWMGSRPLMPLLYVFTHFPNVAKKITKLFLAKS